MKKRFITLGVLVGVVTMAASGIAYNSLSKPKNSEELATKAVLAMSNVKSVDIDGNMDAEASLGSHLSLPANVTFDGNYNVAENTGLLNYTLKTNVLGQDYDYSDQIDLSAEVEKTSDEETSSTEASPAESSSETTESLFENAGELKELLEKSEFGYDKKNQTYSITFKVEDIVASEPIKEMLVGQSSALGQIGITEEQLYDALNDDAEVELTFDSKYLLSEISITSMDVEKDIDLEEVGMGSVASKASFATDIHFSNYL